MNPNGIKPRVVIIHHHIFKNAGTSFNHALAKAFGTRFCEYDLPNGRVVTRTQLARYIRTRPDVLAVSGHHIALPAPKDHGFGAVSSIIIRHPLARVRSIYQFEKKQNAQTDGAVMAKKLNFKEFVSWRLVNSPHVFCNYQTIYCSRIDDVKTNYSPTNIDLEQAIKNIKNCLVIGTVERYEDFIVMAQYEMSHYYPQIFLRNARMNVTAKPYPAQKRMNLEDSLVNELGNELVEELKQKNELDYRLYQFVNNEMDAWFNKDCEVKAHYFETQLQNLADDKDYFNTKAVFRNAVVMSSSSRY